MRVVWLHYKYTGKHHKVCPWRMKKISCTQKCSFIHRTPTFFALRFAFSVIHGSERALQAEEHKWGRLENEATQIARISAQHIYHKLSIQAVCKPQLHQLLTRNHDTQIPTLHSHTPPLVPQRSKSPQQALLNHQYILHTYVTCMNGEKVATKIQYQSPSCVFSVC